MYCFNESLEILPVVGTDYEVSMVERWPLPRMVAYLTSCLAENQSCRSVVPWHETYLEVKVYPAGSKEA